MGPNQAMVQSLLPLAQLPTRRVVGVRSQNIEKSNDKDDISQLTNSFYDMSKTISAQRINLEETNNTISDQLQFINNIIKNSPYGIFVIHNKELIFL